MSDFDLDIYVLEYLKELSRYWGEEVLPFYGDLLEELEELSIGNSQLGTYILQYLWQNSINRSQLRRHMLAAEQNLKDAPSLLADWNGTPARLVEGHYNLVRKAAATFHRESRYDNEQHFQDLLGAAQEALYQAALKYSLSPKGDFKSFAWPILKKKVKEEQSRGHPVPFKVRKKLQVLAELREEAHYRGEVLSHGEIQNGLQLAEGELQSVLDAEATWGSGQEMESDSSGEEFEVADLSPNSLAILLSIEDENKLKDALIHLSDKEKILIEGLYYKDLSLRDLATSLEMSVNNLKKHHKKALRKLKAFVDEENRHD